MGGKETRLSNLFIREKAPLPLWKVRPEGSDRRQ